MLVPNTHPRLSAPYRIAFVGEAPGKEEDEQGLPFVGMSGRLFNALLSKANIVRDACFIGNVCQHKPEKNILANFDWSGPEIQSGIKQLYADIVAYKPNLIVCLGGTALHVIKAGNIEPKKKKTKEGPKFVFPNSIDSWRGSLMNSTIFPGLTTTIKTLAAYHPAFCLRAYENTQILMFDITKAATEGLTPDLVLPKRDIKVEVDYTTVIQLLTICRATKYKISLDIEGYYTGMSCISIATFATQSTIVPIFRKDGTSYWSLDEEVAITRHLAALLADPSVPKVWQNGLYDRWVLQYGFSMPVFGNKDDTMLKWWEKYCELEKNLGMQTSVLTNEPYYKGDRKSQDDATFYRYCCLDSAVTYEINEKLETMLTPPMRAHYEFNHSLLNLFLYIELRGIAYNKALAREHLEEVNAHIYKLQSQLDSICGCGLDPQWSAYERELEARSLMCHKKNARMPKKEYEGAYDKVIRICQQTHLTAGDCGFLAQALSLDMNIKGAKFKTFIYGTLGLEEQYNKSTGAVTTDDLALMKLRCKYPDQPVLPLAIEIARLRTRSQMLAIATDPDGRIRCGYNVVGTVTGRITNYTSPTGSGYNLQTIPDEDTTKPEGHPLRRGMRHLIISDPGHYMFQCDLKGSDGWTIGAHLNRLGDPNMLEDLKAGIKPAQRIAYMVRHGNTSLKGKGRDEILSLVKEIKSSDWDYFALKVGIWGMCLTGDHEVLTPQGWVKFSSLTGTETIATWDSSQSINWEQPTLIRQVYTGNMYSFEGQSFSLLATADHRMPYITNENLKVCTAAQLTCKGARLPKSGHWTETRTEPLAKFYAMVMSDGHYTVRDNQLVFTFRKSRKIERCKEILTSLGITFKEAVYWSERDQTNEHKISCTDAPVVAKRAGTFMLQWSETSLRNFMDEYVYWDGMHVGNNCRHIFSADKDHIEWLATFQALTGCGYTIDTQISGKGSLIYVLKINNRPYASLDSLNRRAIPVSDLPVYCLQTKAGFFLTRRNGKIMVTGNCYLMGPDLLSDVIFDESDGKVLVSRKDINEFRAAVFAGYSLKLWHDYTARQLAKSPVLVSASGNVRRFFGRPQEILGEALSTEPQNNTTYATNLAAYRLWNDPENRVSDKVIWKSNGDSVNVPFRAEPLHQVHDALIGQFAIEDTDWAIKKIRTWFDNPLTIAGQRIVIPFTGKFGPSWGQLDKGTI